MTRRLNFLILASIFSLPLFILPVLSFADWTPLIERLTADNFDEQVIRKIFDRPGVNFDPSAMSCKLKELINKRYKKQDAVSARKVRAAYGRFLKPEVIAEAQSYLQKNRETLQGITENYCVPKEIVVSILLVETWLGRHLGDQLVVLLRNEQRVAGGDRVDVHEGQALVVFEDLRAGDLTGDDLAEDTVGHETPPIEDCGLRSAD